MYVDESLISRLKLLNSWKLLACDRTMPGCSSGEHPHPKLQGNDSTARCKAMANPGSYKGDANNVPKPWGHYETDVVMNLVGNLEGIARTMADGPFDMEMYVSKYGGRKEENYGE